VEIAVFRRRIRNSSCFGPLLRQGVRLNTGGGSHDK
jgi:hypothetical protein